MATRDEVFQETLKYFDGDELAANVFFKYCLKDKQGIYHELTPDDMHKRLASEFARIEKKFEGEGEVSEKEIYDLLKDFKYIVPQGSPMMGIKNNFSIVSLSNCVVIAQPNDSMSGIFDTAKDAANLFKSRCGVGIDLSTLRPDGMTVNNSSGTSTGAWSWSNFFSEVTRMVGQNNRRGALMITMDVRHPDIEKFVVMKHDLTKVTGANISVKISDDFMKAVEEDNNFLLKFPVDSDKPKFSRYIKAKNLWDSIVDSARTTAEPGIIFWDTATKFLPANEYPNFKAVSTNPCSPRDTKVLTPMGIRVFDEIDVGSEIWDGNKFVVVTDKQCTGIKEVFEYHTNAGIFVGTENHRIVQEGKKFEVKDADSIDICRGSFEKLELFDPQTIVDGLVMGDGSAYKSSKGLYIGKDDGDYFNSEISNFILEYRPKINKDFWEIDTTISVDELPRTYERKIPERFLKGSRKTVCSFLRGLYSANGSICGNRITLKASSKQIILDVQIMLSSVGILSYYTTNKPSLVEFRNGEYECKQSYDLNISVDRKKFYDCIGFIQKYKQKRLLETCEITTNRTKISYEIKEIIRRGEEKVYDITVDSPEHVYWTGGLLVSNCSEIILSENDACRLISINLKNFVKNPFSELCCFDFKQFSNVVRIAARMSDDLVELEIERIESIISFADEEDVKVLWRKMLESAIQGRRCGLGTHGLADVFSGMCCRYDSEEALKLTDNIYRVLRDVTYETSSELALERGSFPCFDWNLEKNNAFIKNLPEYLQEKIKLQGRRNISLLTNAPTGSVSILSRTSSGIEPIFRHSYTRRKKINGPSGETKVDFTDQNGDAWEEFKVFHKNIEDYMKLNGLVNSDNLPDFFVSSENINWKNRVKLQGIIQKYIDHSISSTINLPKGTSVSVVDELYRTAWKLGLKGITVYVDESRTGVLVTKKEDCIKESFCPKRPIELECDIHQISVKGQPWVVFVGLMKDLMGNNSPYEIFAGESNKIKIPKKYLKGMVIKKGKKEEKSIYNLRIGKGDEELLISDIVDTFDNDAHAALTRMTSLSLRHGVPVKFLSEQLSKDKTSDMFCFSQAVARVLKKYIADGQKPSSDKLCKSCGKNSLVYQGGCVVCVDCGWSKCS